MKSSISLLLTLLLATSCYQDNSRPSQSPAPEAKTQASKKDGKDAEQQEIKEKASLTNIVASEPAPINLDIEDTEIDHYYNNFTEKYFDITQSETMTTYSLQYERELQLVRPSSLLQFLITTYDLENDLNKTELAVLANSAVVNMAMIDLFKENVSNPAGEELHESLVEAREALEKDYRALMDEIRKRGLKFLNRSTIELSTDEENKYQKVILLIDLAKLDKEEIETEEVAETDVLFESDDLTNTEIKIELDEE